MNTLDLISTVRVHLGRPAPDLVRVSDILIKMSSVVANYRTELKGKDQWHYYDTAEFTLPTNSNDLDLLGIAPNFSKALSIEWLDPGNPSLPGVEIPIVNAQELDQAILAGGTFGVTYGSSLQGYGFYDDIARAFAILGNIANGKAILRANPTPTLQSYRYKLYFEPANQQIQDPSEDLQFPQEFWVLLGYAVAFDLIPNCKFPIDTFNQYRQTLRVGLEKAEMNFQHWANQKKVQQVRISRPFTTSGRGGGWRY